MNLFDARHEAMPREELEQLQVERLQALLARLRRNVPRYRKLLEGVRVESLADLPRLPFTAPTDLAAAFPYGMFALPLAEVTRIHSTIGPGGMQIVVGHTANDLAHWARLAARQLVAAGGIAHHVVQIGFSGGVFGQAFGYMRGAELMEASVIPHDAYHIEYQLAMMQSYRADLWITTPALARELAAILDARGIAPPSLPLRAVLLSRPVSDAEREELKTGLFADIRCGFGLPEVLDPGFSVECPEHRFHVNEDHFLVEAPDGELVVTTLLREAMPLLRYRTQIRCGLERIKCPCGRTGTVVMPGERLDGRLRVNELPVYRNQIETLLGQTRAAGHAFRLEIEDERIRVSLKVTSGLFPDTVREMENLKNEIENEFMSRLGIGAKVFFHDPRAFEGLGAGP